MISQSLRMAQLVPSGIRAFTALAKTVPGCIELTLGEPEFDTPQPIKDAAWAALQAGQTHYAPNQGLPALRAAVAAFETERGFPCTEKQVLITAGATGALFTAFLGTLGPGDEALIPTPAFPLYETLAHLAQATPVFLPTEKWGYQLPAEALQKAVTPRTRAIVLNSPNNPTGVIYTQETLAAVKKAVLGRPITLICDNVYAPLTPNAPDLTLDPELAGQILLCQSFSKPYAMTGWRVGYLIGPEDIIARLVLLGAAAVASVPTFLQTACVTALTLSPAHMAVEYARRREYVCRRLREMGLSFPEPEGGFYVFPDIAWFGLSSDAFCRRMIREAAVAAVPGSCFGGEGRIRISYCCDDAQLALGLDRLEAFLKTL